MGDVVTQFGKVAVLMGGTSAEREVSLKSGKAVLEGLLRCGIDAHGVDAGQDVCRQLEQGGYDRVFIVLHGRGGEDGVIQGVLESMQLPYTGSGVLGSALGMDKLRSKLLWSGMGLPTPAFALLDGSSDFDQVESELGLPLMVKPVHEGSSIGMSKVCEKGGLRGAWQQAAEYDAGVIAEQWIEGSEYTTAILQGEALPLIRLQVANEFYDYEAKYLSEQTHYHCPCGLDQETERQLQQLSLQAFEAIGASGWGRVDLMLDQQQQPWLIEVNTVPGMTDHSLVPMAAKARGIGFDELVEKILAGTLVEAA
jgi:D-alanine-D-alanine ligase